MAKFENVWQTLGGINNIKLVTQIWQLDHKILKPENHDFEENSIIFKDLSTKKSKSYQKSVIFLMVEFENVWRTFGCLDDTKLVTQIWQLDHKILQS